MLLGKAFDLGTDQLFGISVKDKSMPGAGNKPGNGTHFRNIEEIVTQKVFAHLNNGF